MDSVQKVLLALLLTGLFSCSTDQSSSKDPANVLKLDDFEKALSLYAQGLLAFEADSKEGLGLLKSALLLSPYHRKIVDDFYLYTHNRIVKESFMEAEVSDHEKLHGDLIRDFSEILKKFPQANYIRLKLVESYLALDRVGEARKVLAVKGLLEDDSLILAKIRFLRVIDSEKLPEELKRLLNNNEYKKDTQLQLTAIRYLIERGPYENSDQIREHAKMLIKHLPENKDNEARDLPFTLVDAVLYGSDIGETSRSQSVEGIDYGNITAQWSLLAGILMKLEMYEEAYTVLKYRVISKVKSRWRACLSLAICCQKLEKDEERVQYLEEAYAVRPSSSYTSKSLLVSYISSGDLEEAFKIYERIQNPNDFWLTKINFYLLKAAGKYQSAFDVAEKVFTWSDKGQRISKMTVSLASNIVPVYLKLGKPLLMEARLKQAIKYLPGDMSLLNSLAYQFAVADYKLEQAEEWIQEVYENTQVTSSYADTFAWVLYKQGRYEEAKKHIDLAISLGKKKSSEILLHAGDIYQKLGYGKQAKEYWSEALANDPKLKNDIEVRMSKNENSVD